MQLPLIKPTRLKVILLILCAIVCAVLIPIFYQVISVRMGITDLPISATMAAFQPEFEVKLTDANIPFSFQPLTDSEDGQTLSLRVSTQDAHAAQVIVSLVAQTHETATSSGVLSK